jgi:hypothetical protein
MGFVKGQWRYSGVPDFRTKEEALKYFIREEKRWDKGFDGLPGWYYKYLTQYKIKDRYEGYVIHPEYREADHELIFPWLQETIMKNMDGLWLTQRGAGKSTIIGGPAVMETAMGFPGSQVIITADTLTNIQTMFEEKLKPCYFGLHENLRPTMSGQWPSVTGKNMPVVQFSEKFKTDGKWVERGITSVIRGLDTVSKGEGNKVEGQGAKLFVIDELFKHPNIESVSSKSQALTRRYQKKVGTILYVGSCSDATAKGLQSAVDLWTNAGTYGINTLFVPASMLNPEYPVYDADGNLIPNRYESVIDKNNRINISKAEECIKNTRKVLERLPNKRKLIEYILQYPLHVEEILDVNTESWWDIETIEQQKIQKNVVQISVKARNYDSPESRCDRPAILIEDPQTKEPKLIYTTNRENATVFIFREPQPNCIYGMGTDPIPGSTSNEDGSDHVAVVKNFDSNQYDAYMAVRSYDMADICKRQILLQRLYNNCINLPEKNAVGAMLALYKEWGFLNMLSKTPRRFRTKTGSVDYGLNKDSNSTQLQQLVRQYVKDNMGLIYLERFFNEFLRFPYENTDLMSAMAMVEALHEDYRNLNKRKGSDNRSAINSVHYIVDSFGRRVMSKTPGTSGMIKRDGSLSLGDVFRSLNK